MNREEVLKTAEQCVCKDREDQYGSPENNFATIAWFWNGYPKVKESGIVFTPEDVAAMMILLKVARVGTGRQRVDNWVDIAGYAACGGELQNCFVKESFRTADKEEWL